MRHSASRELYEYWNRLREGRPAPRRDEIEPSDIRHLLSDTFILEVSSALKTVSYRLAGTRICSIFGRELKGYGFLGHWSEKDGFEVMRLLARVYRDSQPVLVVMRGYTETGKHTDIEMMLLPIEQMPDGGNRIIGIATAKQDNYWLGVEPLSDCHMRSCRAIDSHGDDHLDDHFMQSPSLAPELTNGESNTIRSSTTRRIAHLIVHDGGKS